MSVTYTWNGPRIMLGMVAKARIALGDFAEQAANHCRDICPVDTGYMKSTITVTAGTKTMRNRDLSFSIIVSAPYATYVEYGTSRNHPQPFVRPTIEWAKANMVKFVGNYVFGSYFLGTPFKMNTPTSFKDTL